MKTDTQTNQRERDFETSGMSRLREMRIEECCCWPIKKMDSIRSAFYRVGKMEGKEFESWIDNESIYVKRVK